VNLRLSDAYLAGARLRLTVARFGPAALALHGSLLRRVAGLITEIVRDASCRVISILHELDGHLWEIIWSPRAERS
jgi:hypothetical protein